MLKMKKMAQDNLHPRRLNPMEKLPQDGEQLEKKDYETLASFRYHLRQFLRFSDQAATSVGLTPQQHQALLAVIGYPGREQITIGELAERLQIKHHSAVGLVDRLESQKLIIRIGDEENHRQVFVRLTGDGFEMIHLLSRAHRKELSRISLELRNLLAQLE
jgi:DNA-binding MarR family transcriptional regulator